MEGDIFLLTEPMHFERAKERLDNGNVHGISKYRYNHIGEPETYPCLATPTFDGHTNGVNMISWDFETIGELKKKLSILEAAQPKT